MLTIPTRRFLALALVCLIPATSVLTGCGHARRAQEARSLMPPEPQREFRAAWVATVGNIDWPTKKGLPVEQQQAEMIGILDRAVALNMNAIVLQVRTSADAFYPSEYEPWSAFLTGTQGRPPEPFYDPLQMWVEEAHKRGLELHAWFNPFRAGTPGRGPEAETHISSTRPGLVKQYGEYLWLDPGEPEAQEHTLNVFLDVVRRYDVDGVHIDDYFYPYPINDKETKQEVDFPDDPSWQAYVASGGKLSRADWRRDNINRQIKDIYAGIKRIKPHVQFGISPFGIWKPGHPPTVKTTFSQYDKLYADAKLWLNEGWCDYYTPQLYWKVDSEQPYRDLLRWWANENTRGRNLWPGLFLTRINDTEKTWLPHDITDQIAITRGTPGATGHVHFSMIGLVQNRKNVSDVLARGLYAEPALIPPSPWLDDRAPATPRFKVTREGETAESPLKVTWKPGGREAPRVWAVYAKHKAAWKLHVFPADSREATLPADAVLGAPTAATVFAVDRSGNLSKSVRAKKPPVAKKSGQSEN
jgi:uncharacterized lipoprotein YddW (UPF0748 family)